MSKENLKGMTFGNLEALEATKERENGYAVWKCRCKLCGGEINVSSKKLKRLTVTNCGCVPKDTAKNGTIAEDLTHHHFGEWEVLGRAPNRKERVMWDCRCSCGTLRTISAHDLKAGKTQSCRNKIHANLYNRKDLTNKVFGRLKALYPTEARDQKGSIYWHCICRCKKELDVTEDELVHGHYRSCGCLKDEIQKNVNNTLHRIDGTCVELLEKRKSRKDNTSGFRGVHKDKYGKYRAGIGFKGRQYYLGKYEKFQDAVEVRLKMERLIHDGFVKAYWLWQKKERENPGWGKSHPLIFEVEKVNGSLEVLTNLSKRGDGYDFLEKAVLQDRGFPGTVPKEENKEGSSDGIFDGIRELYEMPEPTWLAKMETWNRRPVRR